MKLTNVNVFTCDKCNAQAITGDFLPVGWDVKYKSIPGTLTDRNVPFKDCFKETHKCFACLEKEMNDRIAASSLPEAARVPKYTKIMVRNSANEPWETKSFSSYDGYWFFCFATGYSNSNNGITERWAEAKLIESKVPESNVSTGYEGRL